MEDDLYKWLKERNSLIEVSAYEDTPLAICLPDLRKIWGGKKRQ